MLEGTEPIPAANTSPVLGSKLPARRGWLPSGEDSFIYPPPSPPIAPFFNLRPRFNVSLGVARHAS